MTQTPERALVTVRTITRIEPATNADRLEIAVVDGWHCVVGKNDFQAGDTVAFFEIDTLLPMSDPRYESFATRGTKKMRTEDGQDPIVGHVLRTTRIRGNLSQGLILPVEHVLDDPDTVSVGDDITERAGVIKYEQELPDSREIVGGFTSRAPKSNAMRVQNLAGKWDRVLNAGPWEPTVKIDGSSHTLTSEGIYSRNYKIDEDTSVAYMLASEAGLVDAIGDDNSIAIQFEFAGPGVQNNRLGLAKSRIFVFNVYRDGVPIPRSEWPEAAVSASVPVLGEEEWAIDRFSSAEALVEAVEGLSGCVVDNVLDEGIVYRYAGDSKSFPSWTGQTGCIKAINNEYLISHKI